MTVPTAFHSITASVSGSSQPMYLNSVTSISSASVFDPVQPVRVIFPTGSDTGQGFVNSILPSVCKTKGGATGY